MKLRFVNAFDHSISIVDDIDADFIQIPPLILQPYVENAFWHELIPLKRKGKMLANQFFSPPILSNSVLSKIL